MKYEKLPIEYWEKHDYLLFVYDVLGDMLRKADKLRLSDFEIKFDSEEIIHDFEKAEDMFEWMDRNNHHDTSLQMFKNHTFFSLLKDFCFFIYESLSCASRGKVTVAYSLLRKPVRDNLLYLEWLLADPEEFYQTFLFGSVEDCDVANTKKFTWKRKKKIVQAACEKSYMGESLNSDNLVFNFRFDGKSDLGLQRIWNQSMHLVTTHSDHYKTEDGNLNFIFADEEIWGDFWNYYYTVLPQIMAYVLEICEALFIETVDITDVELLFNRLLRFEKYAKLHPHIETMSEVEGKLVEVIEMLDKDSINLRMKCENCGKEITIDNKVANEMISSWFVACPNCQLEHNICKYFIDLGVAKMT